MRRLLPPWFRLPLALGLLAVLSGCGLIGSLRGPRVQGEAVVPGLQAPVRVLRDEHGIPYIFASNTPDLIRAQGFVTAQHRLFQLEGYRAMANGRLAEVVGERGLVNDRQMRLVGLRRNAERHVQRLSPGARDFLGWYAEGLNAYIAQHADDHPRELALAGFTPQPWTLVDMVTVLHYVNWSQAGNFKAELTLGRLIDRFGAERTLRELAPLNVNPQRRTQPAIVGDSNEAPGLGALPLLAGLDAADGPAALLAPVHLGSNNWAIGRSRSASGAAVLVNDPHLDARLLPGIWHPVGLFAPGIQAVGGALPAVPGLLVGRTAQVAFGVTNAYGDSQDLFIERPAPGQPGHYLDGERVRPFEQIDERIRIKDAAAPGGFREETMRVRATVRGPVITGPILGADGERLLSLRMASAELPGGDIGLDRLLTARSAADVDRAAQAIDTMYFNLVFADRDGVIGHRATGRVPVRASRQGSHPKPAGARDDWLGFIPPEQMPGTLAPASDWIATANHDLRPDNYPYDYSTLAAGSYRYRRIADVLSQARGLRTADQLALMLDTRNLQALRLKPILVEALREDPQLADLAQLLQAWDGHDEQSQAGPVLYRALYERLAFETFVDDMGEPLAREWLGQWYAWQERFDELVKRPDSPWFDDQRTPQRETLPMLVRRVAAVVRAELQARHGSDPAAWRWADVNRVAFSSPLRRSGIGRSLLGAPEMPMSGSVATLQRAGGRFLGSGEVEWFASMRLVADLGDDDRVQAVVTGGVVDRSFHPHQQDQLQPWAQGRLLSWWLAPAQVEAHARSEQQLRPR